MRKEACHQVVQRTVARQDVSVKVNIESFVD